MKRIWMMVLWWGVVAMPMWCGAALRLPAVYSDGMVIQRRMPFRVRGEGAPGIPVHVRDKTPDL